MNGPHFQSDDRGQVTPGLRLLVVDAHADAADSLALLLGIWGCDVHVAYTGPDGLAMARQFLPDVVLADLWLPGMDGGQLARCLQEELTGVILIALTGLGRSVDRCYSRDCGFVHHLVKPADPEEIHDLLMLACCHKRMITACLANGHHS